MITQPIHQVNPDEVFQAMGTSPQGLSSAEAASRLNLYGRNTLTQEAEKSGWLRLLAQTTHPLSLLLWAAGGVAFLADDPVLGLVIWLLVMFNAVFSYWREHRTSQAMGALRKLLPAYARLRREGAEISLPAIEIVPGDLIILAEGDNIPADARVVEAFGLRTTNTVLTGEATSSIRTRDASRQAGISALERTNLVFAGTSVVSGSGQAVVYATGMRTEFGRIAHLTQAVRDQPSRLQHELHQLTRRISIGAGALSLVVFVVGAVDLKLGLLPSLLLALGILVAAVPEGLPATLTLTLAMAGQRLAQRNVLVKKLAVLETLGTVSVICTDKNGTLTQNQMTVRDLWAGGVEYRVTGDGYNPQGAIIPAAAGAASNQGALQTLLCAALLCNNSRLRPPHPGNPRWTALGDQTEAAIRVAALKGGLHEEELARQLPRVHELPFDAHRKRMSTVHQLTDGLLPWLDPGEGQAEVIFVKGAPREVLDSCSRIFIGGANQSLDEAQRTEILERTDRFARKGLRVLALACRRMAPRCCAYTPELVERELTFLGLMAMLDPPRPDVAKTIRACRQAGIRMVMVTGDYGLTAEALAHRVGLLPAGEAVIVTGNEIDALDDSRLQALLDQPCVFARMAPEHKLRLVSAFQARGEVVAVTGDGVNDAPALRKADVGVAMGLSGTDVAKEAADIILVNDNFGSIVHAIEEGRAVFENLRKFLTYIFSSNVPEIMPFILTALFRFPLALTVRQILAIDLGTDMLPGLAMGSEKPEPDIMRRLPRRREEPLIDRRLLVRSFLWLGLIETGLAFSGFFLVYSLAGLSFRPLDLPSIAASLQSLPGTQPLLLAVTMYHAGVVMAQVGNAFAARSENRHGRSLGWLSNRLLLAGVALEIVLIAGLIYVPPLARAFEHSPLPPVFWIWLGLYPPALVALDRLRKKWSRRTRLREAEPHLQSSPVDVLTG